MPRATWKGFLRLSLVTCPVYLVPAATKTKSIRLKQIRFTRPVPEPEPEDEEEELARPPTGRRGAMSAAVPFPSPPARSREAEAPAPSFPDAPRPGPATRIALQPVDREAGEQLERSEVTRGYEYDSGQFVTLTRNIDIADDLVQDMLTRAVATASVAGGHGFTRLALHPVAQPVCQGRAPQCPHGRTGHHRRLPRALAPWNVDWPVLFACKRCQTDGGRKNERLNLPRRLDCCSAVYPLVLGLALTRNERM